MACGGTVRTVPGPGEGASWDQLALENRGRKGEDSAGKGLEG